MAVAGEEHFADALRGQQARLIQGVVEHRFLEETHFIRAMAVHEPFVVAVNVRDDSRIVMHHAEQIGGNIAIQVVGKDQVAVGIVHARAVGGDHVRLDAEVIADLPHVDVVAAGGKHKVHAAGSQQRLFRVRRQGVVGGKQRAI